MYTYELQCFINTISYFSSFPLYTYSILTSTFFKPLVVRHVPQAEKGSSEVSSRHVRSRTRELQHMGASISKNEMNVHVVDHLKGKDQEEREALLKEALGKELVLELPQEQSLMMKSDVNLTWFQLNKLRRYHKLMFTYFFNKLQY